MTFEKKITIAYKACQGINITLFVLSVAYWVYVVWWRGADFGAQDIFTSTLIKNYISATVVAVNAVIVIYFFYAIEKEAFLEATGIKDEEEHPFRRRDYMGDMWIIAKPSVAFIISFLATPAISYAPAKFSACFSMFSLVFCGLFIVSPWLSMLIDKIVDLIDDKKPQN
jgi:hypothetical protein